MTTYSAPSLGTDTPGSAGSPSSGSASAAAATAKEQAGQVASTATEHAGRVADTAKESVGQVAGSVAQATSDVAGTAKHEVASVTSEALAEARDLIAEAREQVATQAKEQGQRLVTNLQSLAKELHTMAEAGDAQSPARSLVAGAAQRSDRVAQFLDGRTPGDLIDEASRFARRRPGAFLLGAAAAGMLVGRFARSTVATSQEQSSAPTSAPAFPTSPALAGYPAPGLVDDNTIVLPEAGIVGMAPVEPGIGTGLGAAAPSVNFGASHVDPVMPVAPPEVPRV